MITPHFSRAEMEHTSTGLANELPDELIGNATLTCCALEEVRAVLGRPLRLARGYSTLDVNRLVGGATNSQHIYALAADVLSSDAMSEARRLFDARDRLPMVGKVIVERGHLHIEPRTKEGGIVWLEEVGDHVYRRLWT